MTKLECRICTDPVDQVVFSTFFFNHFCRSQRVLSQFFMQLLAIAALFHCAHHNIFCSHKRKFLTNTHINNLWIDDNTITDVNQYIENRINCKESFCHRNSFVCRIIQGSLKPLGCRSKCRVESIDNDIACQRANPLAAHRIAFIGHCRRTNLMCFKGFFHFLKVLQDTHVRCKFTCTLRNSSKGGEYLRIHFPGVGLSGNRNHAVKTHFFGNHLLEFFDFF